MIAKLDFRGRCSHLSPACMDQNREIKDIDHWYGKRPAVLFTLFIQCIYQSNIMALFIRATCFERLTSMFAK